MSYTAPDFDEVFFDDAGAAYDPPAFDQVFFGGLPLAFVSIAATESSDSVNIATLTPALAQIAATESSDAVAISAEALTLAQIAATETTDSVAIGTTAPVAAQIAATEASDSVSINLAGPALVQIAATESGDAVALSSLPSIGASIAATESGDRVAIAALPAAIVFLAATESSDRVRIIEARSLPDAVRTELLRRARLLLHEPLPLRTSRMLGNFAEDFVLAHRYGDLTSGRFRIDRLDDRTFFAADHPMTIGGVYVDAQTSQGWEAGLRSDSAGHTWTIVAFSAPVPNESTVSATGTGKRNPRNGALLENPADIIEDVLRIAGRTDRWWDQLRAEADAEGLRLAGSITEAGKIHDIISDIADSAGAIWCPGMARLYPAPNPTPGSGQHVAKLGKERVSNIAISANLDNTADVLRLAYDPDSAGDRAQHYVELTASPKLYGGIHFEQVSNWLRNPANAVTVGTRFHKWRAGERYDVAFDCGDRSIRPGQWVEIIDHPEWEILGPDPIVMVLDVDVLSDANKVRCSGKALLSDPLITVTAHSVALPNTREPSVDVAVSRGQVTLRPRDADGAPIYNATAQLDGGETKKTDRDGKVTFAVASSTPPKPHRFALQAPGKRATVQTIWL